MLYLKEKIENHNKKSIDIIAGGSLTFLPHSERKNVILSPGTTLLLDVISDKLLPESPFQIDSVIKQSMQKILYDPQLLEVLYLIQWGFIT